MHCFEHIVDELTDFRCYFFHALTLLPKHGIAIFNNIQNHSINELVGEDAKRLEDALQIFVIEKLNVQGTFAFIIAQRNFGAEPIP